MPTPPLSHATTTYAPQPQRTTPNNSDVTPEASNRFGKVLKHAKVAAKPSAGQTNTSDKATHQPATGKTQQTGEKGKAQQTGAKGKDAVSGQSQIKPQKVTTAQTGAATKDDDTDVTEEGPKKQAKDDQQGAQADNSSDSDAADKVDGDTDPSSVKPDQVSTAGDATAAIARHASAKIGRAASLPSASSDTGSLKRSTKVVAGGVTDVRQAETTQPDDNTAAAEAAQLTQLPAGSSSQQTAEASSASSAAAGSSAAVGCQANGANMVVQVSAVQPDDLAEPVGEHEAQTEANTLPEQTPLQAPVSPVISSVDAANGLGASKDVAQLVESLAATTAAGVAHAPAPAALEAKLIPVASPAPEARFAADNHPTIITGVRGQLLPHGGTMQIRLDPPDMGALQIRVEMRDGVMNATFQTSNEEATHLLSHSLSQLKSALEAQGVSVEKLQVQQAPRGGQAANDEHSSQQQGQDADAQQEQEQQRRQTLRRLWRRLSVGNDPLDLVA